jgi:hypothetical protein
MAFCGIVVVGGRVVGRLTGETGGWETEGKARKKREGREKVKLPLPPSMVLGKSKKIRNSKREKKKGL